MGLANLELTNILKSVKRTGVQVFCQADERRFINIGDGFEAAGWGQVFPIFFVSRCLK